MDKIYRESRGDRYVQQRNRDGKKVLDEISQDEHERYLAEMREKYILDQNATEAAGYDKGLKEGHKKGIEEGIKEGHEYNVPIVVDTLRRMEPIK